MSRTHGQTRGEIAQLTGLSVEQTSVALVRLREKRLAFWRRTPNTYIWFRR